jgi:hypothetical protein
MKKQTIILLAALAIAAFSAHAEADPAQMFLVLEEYLGDTVGLPVEGAMGGLYNDETFNIYTMEGSEVAHAIVSDGIFTELNQGVSDSPTMKIYIADEATIREVFDAENPLDTFYELKKEGKIKLDPVGAVKNIKYFFVNLFGIIISWFS